MKMNKGIKILGTGSSVPGFEVHNNEFSKIVETSDEWIAERTGIRYRRLATEETAAQLACNAAFAAIQDAGIQSCDIGLVIAATCTSDYLTPSLACLVHEKLGLSEKTLAFDLNAACSGFLYSLNTAYGLLHTMADQKALIIGCEVLSRVTDFTDRGTCVLFGDGAGAAVLELNDENPFVFDYGAMGDHETLFIPARYSGGNPFEMAAKEERDQFLHMDGTEVYRFAVENFPKSARAVLEKSGVAADDVHHYVCHQANLRIIKASAKKLGVDASKFFVNIDKYGNTSAASVAIALDELNKSGDLKRGQRLVLAGFGGGLTYGAAYMVW